MTRTLIALLAATAATAAAPDVVARIKVGPLAAPSARRSFVERYGRELFLYARTLKRRWKPPPKKQSN